MDRGQEDRVLQLAWALSPEGTPAPYRPSRGARGWDCFPFRVAEDPPLLTAGLGLGPWPRAATHLFQRQGLEVQGVEDLAQDLCHVVHSGLEGGEGVRGEGVREGRG